MLNENRLPAPLESMFIYFCPSPNSASFPFKCRYMGVGEGSTPSTYLAYLSFPFTFLNWPILKASLRALNFRISTHEVRTFGVIRMFDLMTLCVHFMEEIKCYSGRLPVIRPPCPVTVTQ